LATHDRKAPESRNDDDQPLRAELFSISQLERHARSSAAWHETAPALRRGDWLLERLASNKTSLLEAYLNIVAAVRGGMQITPAAEWFIDNYHLIEDHVVTARKHLPPSYSRELPQLVNSRPAAAPRVYHMAIDLISHAHGRVDTEGLRAFVSAYQEIQTLQLGELWAIPIMLRLALIENLRRVATRVIAGRRERALAALWAAKMTEAATPERVVLVLAELIQIDPSLTDSFVAELVVRLQGHSAMAVFPMAWIEQRLSAQGSTVEHVFERVSQGQAADQVSIGNSIGSLRFLTATDWRDFVEAMSGVEGTLRQDPCYAQMDFATRDRYRHVIERIARHSETAEIDVARAAIDLSVRDDVHVGHVLLEDGVRVLERAVGMRRPAALALRYFVHRHDLTFYLGAIAGLTALLSWPWLGSSWTPLLVLCASQLAISCIHLVTTVLVPPKVLPRLDFSRGIQPAHRTMVAIPTMLTDNAEIDALTEALELRFLANRDSNLSFALVTDFRDAITETADGDEELLDHAVQGITRLNAKYPPQPGEGFFLFHRARVWCAADRTWMGWERKRGKLEELNAALRGETSRFHTIVGPVKDLGHVRYVIALDSDTQLPRDSARLLAATLAHPLNQPSFDEKVGRVTRGYTILQPRVGASMQSISRSRFARLFGGEAGIDPYTRAVSDVYQDVFAEGSFVGKGIYDVDSFQRVLRDRFPDNRILSHDLIEGAYARAALVSDVILIDDFPATQIVDMSRRHRWMRGDWQILSWLWSRVPGRRGRQRNALSWLSQWKVLDNLRRSLVPVALLAMLLVGWSTANASFVTLSVCAILLLPGWLSALTALARRADERSRGSHLREISHSLLRQVAREAFALACLPQEALLSLDATARTLWRLTFSRRRLLEWRTSSDSQRQARRGIAGAFVTLWSGPALAASMVWVLSADALLIATPVLVSWLLSPGLSWWLSVEAAPKRPQLSPTDREFLEALAKRTWSFFETFVTAEDNWLPPDNYQADPPRGVAHRTSPTNIGMALIANLAAYDFGYLSLAELIERTTQTLATLDRLPRFRTHFYNWYDTITLEPLRPMYVSTVDSGNLAGHLLVLAAGLEEIENQAETPVDAVVALHSLAQRCRVFGDLDYEFLYDRPRHLLRVGYSVPDHRLDASPYDLLASEARLASFIAIAQGKLPQQHWFSLGRQLTTSAGKPALLSWSGSMFEYLMPLLVMPTYEGTLLDETYKAVVERQISYGRERAVPWGVSECGYNETDAHLNYQYRAFGVPGLGFKRGLSEDLVIAPYASALALMVAPEKACANLRRLADEGRLGMHGFFEAIDYTPSRLLPGSDAAVITSYMAHHQGMTLLSLLYLLRDRPMQRRFSAIAEFRATDLLLQEHVPRSTAIFPHGVEDTPPAPQMVDVGDELRVFVTPNTPVPEVHLLSNGRYHLAITNAGGGYSRWRDLAVTRFHEDSTRDAWGSFVYVRDVDTRALWSVAHQPTCTVGTGYEAIFSKGRAEFRRVDHEIETHVEIAISPEDDIELRRVNLTNRSRKARTIELTTYAEVLLCPPAADAAHPAFSNLFVQTELVEGAIVCTRRPRSGAEKPPFMAHMLVAHGRTDGAPSYETSRAKFIGRGRTLRHPAALEADALSNTTGSVLDPIVSIRARITLLPDESAHVQVVTAMAETRDGVLALMEKYRDRHAAERVLELSWTHSQVVQRRLDASNADTRLYERVASSVLFSNASLRAPSSLLARNRGNQSGLWAYSISGDVPVVLVRIADLANIELLKHMVRAHAYWRLKGMTADLIIWNEDASGYRQLLHEEILTAVAAYADASMLDRPGGIFVRRSEQISEQDKVLIQTVARVIVSDSAGTFADQVDRPVRAEPLPALLPRVVKRPVPPLADALEHGFSHDGREYVIKGSTPAPWVNVIANPWFGSVISERGSAYTWCENAHSYRLTPWHNDAVLDPSGEAFYLRDETDGHVWSPTPQPIAGAGAYTTRHGFGYSAFETTEAGVSSELCTFVALDAPVKFVSIKLRNRSARTRQLSLTGVFELVLGANRAANAPYVVSERDTKTSALFARNSYNSDMGARIAFLDSSELARTVSGDRNEIIGRNGHLSRPACMARQRLSGRMGAGLDPCFGMQVMVTLADGEEREVCFTFGSGRDLHDARTLVNRFRGTEKARLVFEAVTAFWRRTLGAVVVNTPDPSLNHLANGWLLYQTIACRMWARSGFYQSGGAYGFRDQLQDAMALLHASPPLVREQILRSASRQFIDGDVQHWWHPPMGRGVRTHISDDYLWLPYAVSRYVTSLGDVGLLEEQVAFLEGRHVKPEEDSYYDLPNRSEQTDSVYVHCKRAIEYGCKFGSHGLPLMGSGDWNDGMNLVGEHGRGESVWLAFFLYDVLTKFAPIARKQQDDAFAEKCLEVARNVRENIDAHAWDGAWYLRAYFDDGTPLGSSENVECQIDSLPQSWAVLSGAGREDRALQGLRALDQRLVRRNLGVVQLFDPPFDASSLEPGYIKGYVPGVRENGGQYTHAAVWAAMAFAAAGQTERAWELFSLINPVHHGRDPAYKVEPYVMAADVYTNPQHAGRGGWTWYTGSAGWMYQLITESLLGIHRETDRLRVAPKLPADWPEITVQYRFYDTPYSIHVSNGGPRVTRVSCDGVDEPSLTFAVRNDKAEHRVEITLT
jgi:cyclic beta-1,2-glucan synthetase